MENLTAVNHKLTKDGNAEIPGQAAGKDTTGFPVIKSPQVVLVPTAGLQTGLQVNNLQTGVQSVPRLNMVGLQTNSDQWGGLKPVTSNIDTGEAKAIQGVQITGIQYPVGVQPVSLQTTGIQPSFPTGLSPAVVPVIFQQTGFQFVTQTAGLPQTVLQTAGLPQTVLQTDGLPQVSLQTPISPQTVLQTAGLPQDGLQIASAPQSVLQEAGSPQVGLQTTDTSQSVLQTAGLPEVGLQTADIPQVGLQTASAPQTGLKTFDLPQNSEQEQNNR